MPKIRDLFSIAKLVIICILLSLIVIIILTILNLYIFKLHYAFLISVILYPIISIAFCLIKNWILSQKAVGITKVKYSQYFPVLFSYDDGPIYYRSKCFDSLKDVIQPGDILLRRYDNYLDGLILSQSSYYTHAAIYYGEHEGKENQVIHAVGEGVRFEDIEKFAKCDAVAVLRFDFDQTQLPSKLNPYILSGNAERRISIDVPKLLKQLKGSVFDNSNESVGNVRLLIEADSETSENQKIAKMELSIYDSLLNQIIKHDTLIVLPKDNYISLIREIVKTAEGKGYDFLFNFTDFKKFSCVELVWYCYKFLYPLHQVSRYEIGYFDWIKTFTLVPDTFLTSISFKLIYTDQKEVTDYENGKTQLIDIISKQYLNFWSFAMKLLLTQIMLLLIVYGIVEFIVFVLKELYVM